MKAFETLSVSELTGAVEMFPWFAAARMELYVRKLRDGEELPPEAALYAPSRKMLFDVKRSLSKTDYKDKDIEHLIREAPKRKVVAVGGDFFSQDQYEEVRLEGDSSLGKFIAQLPSSPREEENTEILMGFCTETLAQIYADQGYYKQAKYIYSQLLLRYPEKNAYFAALIQKLEEAERN